MNGHARQLEVIVGTFEIENLWQKLENLFYSLIMRLIMGGSEFFTKFLLGLSHQWRPRTCVLIREGGQRRESILNSNEYILKITYIST